MMMMMMMVMTMMISFHLSLGRGLVTECLKSKKSKLYLKMWLRQVCWAVWVAMGGPEGCK